MKLMLSVMAAIFGVSAAAPQFGNNNRFNNNNNRQYNQPQPQFNQNQNIVPIVSYTNDINPDGSFQYSYQGGDGTSANAQGSVVPSVQRDSENPTATAVKGSYSYTSPEGQVITVTYVADEYGYRAEGAHLPTPPPIPAEIAKSLELIQVAQKNNPPLQNNYNQNRFG